MEEKEKPLGVDPLERLEDNPLADGLRAEIVNAKEARSIDVMRERLRAMEDELGLQAHAIMKDALCFRDVNPMAPEESPDWVDIPADERQKRLRLASAAWLGKKDAPVGIALAAQVVVGIAKARAAEKEIVQPQLNVTVAVLSAPMPQFEEIIIEKSDRE